MAAESFSMAKNFVFWHLVSLSWPYVQHINFDKGFEGYKIQYFYEIILNKSSESWKRL